MDKKCLFYPLYLHIQYHSFGVPEYIFQQSQPYQFRAQYDPIQTKQRLTHPRINRCFAVFSTQHLANCPTYSPPVLGGVVEDQGG